MEEEELEKKIKEEVENLIIKLIESGYFPSDYPQKGKAVAQAKQGENTILLTDAGTFFPARHVCQRCKSPLIATDYFDYICNKCSGAW